MALTKEISYDYEIRGIGKNIQQRRKTAIMEDGKELSSGYHRRVYSIGMSLEGIEDETVVKSLSSSLWTQEVSSSYSLLQTSQSLSL
tara:strand:+ start:808 stop:1068 length:261 start_codon:yes stop_codon:yes gene_type:complete